jgi:hypothetical protein
MSSYIKPRITYNGLFLSVDSANSKSDFNVNRNRNLLSSSSWTANTSGSVGFFSRNGAVASNWRTITSDPWGNNDVIWIGHPLYQSEASAGNGGWVTSQFPIDCTKMYRYSQWMKVTVSGSSNSSGNQYLGIYAYNSAATNVGVQSKVAGTTSTNFYLFSGNINRQGEWVLVVGHVWPYATTTGGSVYTDTGIYNTAGTKVWAQTTDCVWLTTASVSAAHRSYLYYSGNTAQYMYWTQPRVDLIDGNQLSLTELINNAPTKLNDLSRNNNICYKLNDPAFSATAKGAMIFNGVGTQLQIPYGNGYDPTLSSLTIEAWVKSNIASGQRMWLGWNGDTYVERRLYSGLNTSTVNNMGIQNAAWDSGIPPDTNWHHQVLVIDSSASSISAYDNGSYVQNKTFTSYSISGNFMIGGNSSYWLGYIGLVNFYNRILTPSEILQNYNATKRRFLLT